MGKGPGRLPDDAALTWDEWDRGFRKRLDRLTQTTDDLRRVLEHRLSSEVEISDAVGDFEVASKAMSRYLRQSPPWPRTQSRP